MSRRERAIKHELRQIENGRSSFKAVYVDCIKADGNKPNYTEGLKKLNKELKDAKQRTREYNRKTSDKEVIEV